MELRLEKRKMKIAPLGEESCVPDLFGEVIIQNQLRFHLGEEEELYEGYGRIESAYPYRQRNGYSRKLKEEEVQTAVLENSLLKAVFLTGYGGRLWELWDKATGKNLLYTNDILRFSNLAVRNAWFSGGIEWNIGIIGHTPFTTEPLYIARTETESGVPVLRMYEYERIRDVTYQMDFWLEEESPGLNCRIRIVNEKTEIVPMYWWSNIAVPEFEGGRVIVPAKSAYTCTEKLVHKVEIPLVGGIDITDYKKIPKSVDYFFELEEDSPKYIANVDKDGYGLLQLSTARLRSRKLFSWGNQAGSNHWQEYLTENAGRYLEIQAGLAKEHTPDADIIEMSKVTDLVAELVSGKMDGAFIETMVAESYAKSYPELCIALEVPYDAEGSVVGVSKGNAELLAGVNEAIAAALADGSMAKFVEEANELANGEIIEGLID